MGLLGATVISLARGPINLTVDIEGEDISIGFTRLSAVVNDFTDFWTDYFAPRFYADMAENFATEGRLSGAGWAPLSPAYDAWKIRQLGFDPGILRFTDALLASLTSAESPDAIFDARPNGLTIGTAIPYARKHQDGDPSTHLPARPFMYLRDDGSYQSDLNDFVRALWIEYVGPAGLRA